MRYIKTLNSWKNMEEILFIEKVIFTLDERTFSAPINLIGVLTIFKQNYFENFNEIKFYLSDKINK